MSNLISTTGEVTPFEVTTRLLVDEDTKIAFRKSIEAASKASAEELVDVTPLYWEARTGDKKIMVFCGFKAVNKKDDAGIIIGQEPACVFHDGDREIIAKQVALRDAMKSCQIGATYIITCLSAQAKSAKKFSVILHKTF